MRKNEMLDISSKVIQNVKECIIQNKLIENQDKIILALSGGPDSVTLLDILSKLKNELNMSYEIIVAHVNHMLREESEQEKEYVEDLCKKYNVEFNYLKIDIKNVAKELKISEEMAGREKRYEFFYRLLREKNANKIAIAHNLDDNAETILLNIIRGCGTKGLTGIKYKNNFIIRPLLNVEKNDILLYTKFNNLNPCFDKTNDENVYLRNKIRNILIPALKDEYNSNIVQNIIKMSQIINLDNDFLEDYTQRIFNNSVISKENDNIVFNYEILSREHDAIKRRLIRKLLESINMLQGIQNINVEDILDLFEKNITGKKYIKKGKFSIVIVKKNIAKIYIGEEL